MPRRGRPQAPVNSKGPSNSDRAIHSSVNLKGVRASPEPRSTIIITM